MHGFGFGLAGLRGAMSEPASRCVAPPPPDCEAAARAAAAAAAAREVAGRVVLLDPAAEAEPTPFPLVPRSGAVPARIALPGINKPKGNVLLDAAGARLRREHPHVEAIHRYAKPGPSRVAGEELKRAILADHNGALIAGLADWGSCITCTMHDTAWAEASGMISVTVLPGASVPQSDYNARCCGNEDLARLTVPHPIQCNDDALVAQEAEALPGKLVAALTTGGAHRTAAAGSSG